MRATVDTSWVWVGGLIATLLGVLACTDETAQHFPNYVPPVAQGGQGGQSDQPAQAGQPPDTSHWSWQACGTLDYVVKDASGRVHPTTAVAVSPDGAWLLAATGYGTTLFRLDPELEHSKLVREDVNRLYWYGLFSNDSTRFAISGDGPSVVDISSGDLLWKPSPSPGVQVGCYTAHLAFSNAGAYVAGADFGFSVQVRNTKDFTVERELPAPTCNSSAAFSPDDTLLATSEPALYRTSDWTRLWPEAPAASMSPPEESPYDVVQFSPDGSYLVVSKCTFPAWNCRHIAYSLDRGAPGTEYPLARPLLGFSADGSWLIAGGGLLHRPTQTLRQLDPNADAEADAGVGAGAITAGTFEPNGDIIVGRADGTMQRWCRRP
jgi:WD40 repeat protein